MNDDERSDGEPALEKVVSDGASLDEGLIIHVSGPTTEGIRVVDSRGWTAAGDVEAGTTTAASATGKPSHGEDLTLETATILTRRLNCDGATWSDPVRLDERTGGGVDCEATDIRNPRRRLPIQVTRAEVDREFSTRLTRETRADIPRASANETALRLWAAIQNKRFHAQPDVVLALNAVRTPWLALGPVVDAFRRQHGQDARRIGFNAVWIVGANEAFTEQLDVE